MQSFDISQIVSLAPWLFFLFIIASIFFSFKANAKRRKALEEFAAKRGFIFSTNSRIFDSFKRHFRVFDRGRRPGVSNCLSGEIDGNAFELFTFFYTTGNKNSRRRTLSVIAFTDKKLSLPQFELVPEAVFDRLLNKLGFQDIDFPEQPDFSRKFRLQGQDETAVRAIFNADLIRDLISRPAISIEAHQDVILFYLNQKVLKLEEIDTTLNDCLALKNLFK